MNAQLLNQRWKKLVRAKYFSQGWGVKILMGFLVLYFSTIFLLIGFAMPEIIAETHPDAEKLSLVFLGFILYYMLMDITMRFFLQDLSVLSIQHYLIQPLKKGSIINFLLGGSVFNFFNLLPLFIVIPFAIRILFVEYDIYTSFAILFTLIFIVLINHFLAIYVKRALAIRQSLFFLFAAVIGGFLLVDYLGYISLFEVSRNAFSYFINYPWLVIVPLAILLIVYRLNFSFLYKHTYLDLWQSKSDKDINTERFQFLESRGIIGSMVANELKLIIRNKRTKSVLFITFLFSLYGLLFYANPEHADGWVVFIFVGIFMTGIFMINYGQFLVSWESAYFDGILTRYFSTMDYYRAKFFLLAGSCIITYILSIPYVYFGMKALYINTACFIYNLGFNSFIILFASTYHKKRIDLKGSAFNYQGTSATQFLVVIPLMIVPVLIFQAFNIFDKPYWGLGAISLIGLISLAFIRQWFQFIVTNFQQKKYIISKGFRESA